MRYAAMSIFIVAVAVRLLVLTSHLVPGEWIVRGAHREVDAVARSLATTGKYADPYAVPTGPTGHPPPVHTALQALIYLTSGITPAAGWARSIAGILFFAASLAVLPFLGERTGLGRRAGLAAGLFAAIVPLNGIDDILGWLWNESMTALALAWLMALFVARWEQESPPPVSRSLLLGLFAGASFHVAPPLLPVIAGFLTFEAWGRRARLAWPGVAAIIAGALLACLPWAWRMQRALGEPFFIRSNFGLELRISNHDRATANPWASPGLADMHPGNSVPEAERVRQMGEAAYMGQLRRDTLAWIGAHPSRFLLLTASRVWHIWMGPTAEPLSALPVAGVTLLAAAGLARRWRSLRESQRAAIAIPLAAYPLVFYLVGYVPRYVFPIQGVLLLLAASVFVPADARAVPSDDRGLTSR